MTDRNMAASGKPVEPPLFSVTVEARDDAIFLLCKGELDLAGQQKLISTVESAWTTAPPSLSRVVLDASEITFIDSSGLHALLMCRDRVAAQGVEFLLRAPAGGPVERLVDLAGVRPWFDCN